MTTTKGWKVFDKDLKCRGHQFIVGGTYEVSGPIVMCKHGWHFHTRGGELFNYYSNSTENRVCEIVATDFVTEGDKSVCRKIEIGRELTLYEICILRYGNGNGNGYGYGYGDGYGNGNGYGYGYGDGYGNGNGYGNGYGYGNGNGNGYGDGYGNGNGNGYGYGDGNGNGNGKYQPFPAFIKFETEKAA